MLYEEFLKEARCGSEYITVDDYATYIEPVYMSGNESKEEFCQRFYSAQRKDVVIPVLAKINIQNLKSFEKCAEFEQLQKIRKKAFLENWLKSTGVTTYMKLDSTIPYVTSYTDKQGLREGLEREFPSSECISQPSILVILKDGVYLIAKSRYDIKGDPKSHPNSVPLDPYELEFKEFKLADIRAMCTPKQGYLLPEGYAGSYVLIVL